MKRRKAQWADRYQSTPGDGSAAYHNMGSNEDKMTVPGRTSHEEREGERGENGVVVVVGNNNIRGATAPIVSVRDDSGVEPRQTSWL